MSPTRTSPADESTRDPARLRAAAIDARGLRLCYGKSPALDDVTLSIRQQAITALIGPSGCGKTSFLSCINRLTDLVSGCSVSGSLRLGNTDVLSPHLDVVTHRRKVGMIFQKPNPFPMSVRRNLEMPLREHGVTDREQRDHTIEATLRRVGLWDEVGDRLQAHALQLSGGQQQRLCIARALALEPQVLLMDEPCSALDPISSGIVEDLIVSLRERLTVVVVTHNLAQARRIADDAAVFWVRDGCGRVVESGPVSQIFAAPRDPITAAYVSGARG